ncbi:MAG: DUF364 domain-containing protein [Candidatus Zixiibacteriota bacterium]|nr:MAG: DUF364 domain-containing protein [candidate division Zixibacteria bacterium]
MKLIEDLLDGVRDCDCPIRRVCVGLHWTVVESKYTGIAHTYKSGSKVELEFAGELIGKSAFELAERLRSPKPLEASLGVAALNSLIDANGRRGNVLTDVIEMVPGKTVTVVGRFPVNDKIVQTAHKAYILEMEPGPGELPPESCEDVIPASDIVLITATALINHTLPRLLELAAKAKTIVLGPTTPMNDVLFDYGANIIAGVRIVDADTLINSVTQGVKKFKKLGGVEAIIRP